MEWGGLDILGKPPCFENNKFRIFQKYKHRCQVDTNSPYAAIGTVSGSVQDEAGGRSPQGSNIRQYFAVFAGMVNLFQYGSKTD